MKTFLRLIGLLRPFAGEVLLSILLGTATVASGIGLLGTSAYLIATAALQPGIAPLQVAIVGVRFFGINRGVFRYLERLVSHSANFRLLAQLRVWFYQAVEPLVPARLSSYQSGDLLNRAVADVETLQEFYIRLVAPPCVALLVTLGMGWFTGRYAFIFGWILTGGLLIAGLVIPAAVYGFTRTFGRKVTQQRSQLSALFVDFLQGMPEWTVFGQEERILGDIDSAGFSYDRAQEKAASLGSAGNALGLLVNHTTVWAVVLAAIPLVRSGSLDGVSMAVLALMALASFEAILPLNQAVQQLEGALQSARRLFELADQPAAVTDPLLPLPMPVEFRIQVNGLTYRYAASSPIALEEVSLNLAPGRRIALVGPSGAGKSTLAGLLLRFWDAPVAAILVDGQDIHNYRAEDIRAHIAVISQSAYIFSGMLAENILLANPDIEPAALNQVVQSVGLESLLACLPEGLQGWVGSQGAQLSGGERQRIAVARALVKNASLLILDEPAANLDTPSGRQLVNTILKHAESKAVLWISHDLEGLEKMDEIIVLHAGKVIERGSHAQLIAQGGWYASALALQRQVLFEGGTSEEATAS
jgi:ATP-binding cassette subfamily C protein CydC